jgi:glycerate dehydrogenase
MKIVILDAHTANPGDLSWAAFEQLGQSAVFDRTPESEIVARAQDAEIILTNKAVLSRATLAALPRLRYVGVTATGYNVVDVAAAREHGVTVTNVPDYGTPSVAQAVFALILELTNRTGHHAQTVRDGRWVRSPDWCYWDFPLIELKGLTLGIAGLGQIGESVAHIGRAFGMNVIAVRRNPTAGRKDEIEFTDLDTLFRRSDVLSLHCPLTPETRGLVNRTRLGQMKSTAFLINTARGPLVDEAALAAALNEGRIAGAGLDVLSVEPPPANNPLLGARNCFITPHVAWASRSARQRLLEVTLANVRAFLAGKPQNVVYG